MKPSCPALALLEDPDCTLAMLLQQQARQRPDAAAILAPGRSALTYAGLWSQVRHVATVLHSHGVTPSVRVAVMLPNGPEMATAFLGVSACAACVPVNPGYQAAELRSYLAEARARVVIVRKGEGGPLPAVARDLGLGLLEIDVDTTLPAGQFRLPPGSRDLVEPHSPAQSSDIALVLPTSGTTARPKIVLLEQAHLVATIRTNIRHFALSPADRCLNVRPLFHTHGLVSSILATVASGGSVVCAPGLDGDAFFDWVAQYQPTWYSAVPTMHQWVLAHGAQYRQRAPEHRFRFLRSGAAPLAPATLRSLEALMNAPLIEAYGMTERTPIAINPLPPGVRKPGSVGLPAGVEIMLIDEAGRRVPPGAVGEITIRGPGVIAGYENHADADDSCPDGWFRTGDQGRFDDDGYLFITGRLKEVVNRGGQKISPREVDEALLEHPAVAQAAAFGVPHATLGEELAAAVVLHDGATVGEAGLRGFLFERLAQFKLPSTIVFVESLPVSAVGKVRRGELRTRFGKLIEKDFVSPRTGTQCSLGAIFREILGCGPVGLHDGFFALGGDSLKGTRAMARINERHGVALSVPELFRYPTIAELAVVIDAAGGAPLDTAVGPAAELLEADGRTAQATPHMALLGEPNVPSPAVEAAASAAAASGNARSRLLALRRQRHEAARTLERRPGSSEMALSFAQEGLWFLDKLTGPSGVYNMARAVRLQGTLDVAALEHGVRALVERHESLRTAFEDRQGVPTQRVRAFDEVAAGLRLAPVPVAGNTPDEREQALGASLQAMVAAPFDLSCAPLLRAQLWRMADDEHVLLLVVHHIVSDGWSMGVLARELGALYACARNGSVLPPLPVQYGDHALWQRRRLASGIEAQQLQYWREQLRGLQTLELPTDRPRPVRASQRGAVERFVVPGPLVEKLHAVARRENATLFMLLLTAYQVLLMRHSGQQDLAVGVPVAGRNRVEFEGLIGLFVNTVVLRTDLSGNPEFTESLRRVRETALDAFAHQDLPFDRLVAELSPQRDLSRNPLYQVSFALQSHSESLPDLGGLAAQPIGLPVTESKFDLSLALTEVDGVLQGVLEYATDLFDAGSIERMGRQLGCVLEAIAADPGQSIMRLPLMRADEREHVLQAWNDTAREFPAQHNLHQLFEAQVRRSPQAIAVILDSQQLGYAELNRRANRLAHHLRTLGVGPDVLVGLCLQRSPALVVALLAILKAGGAYVPLDPQYPSERLAFMLGDTAAPVVITEQALRAQLPGGSARVLCIDSDWAALAHQPDTDLPALATPEHLAYVIYTSGSTGTPKGVAVSHRGICNHNHWITGQLGLGAEDRLLQKTSISFDASVWELFAPLTAGAALVLVKEAGRGDAAYVARTIRDHHVTIAQSVPSELSVLLDQPSFCECRSLRYMVCGGEALDRALARRFAECLPDATLANCYGPTEASIDSTCFEVHAVAQGPGTVPIGRPVANARCHILDAWLQPVPIGAVGELHVGGVGLARGYLNRPELTAERFIRDPFREGERLYRTGDLARYLPDGTIEYIGRVDHQVKIRGFRIELGEIEARMASHPQVVRCVAVVREDRAGDPRLVAYVVARGGMPSADVLQAHLRAGLPEYMLPNHIVELEAIPLTPNGKLDRKALPVPNAQEGATPVHESPRGEVELTLARLWAEALGVERVGRHDDFFKLGGHSLLAIRLIERMRRAGLAADVHTLFAAPTLAALAAAVGGGSGEVQVPPNLIPPRCGSITPHMLPLVDLTVEHIARIVATVPGGAANVQDIYPLAPLQEGILFHHLAQSEGDRYLLRDLFAFADRAQLDAYLRALQQVVDRHDILRTAVLWEDLPEPLQVVWRHAPLSIEELQLDPAEGDVAHQLQARFDPTRCRIDVREASMLRVRIAYDEPHARWIVVQLFHHLATDHTSKEVLEQEVQAHLVGRADRLSPPVPFRNFVAQTRLGVSREEHEAFFRTMLADVDEPTTPFGLVGMHGSGADIAEARRAVDAGLAQRLFRGARALGVSAASVCHLAWALVLARATGRDDVVFGTVLFGRMQGGAGADRALGLFVNTLPLRVRLGDASALGGLNDVHALFARLLRHEHAPLALAQRCSAVAAPAPLFSALLNYRRGVAADEPPWTEVSRARAGIEVTQANLTNYPLTLSVDDLGDALTLTVQVQSPVRPERVCEFMHAALEQLVSALESAPETPLYRLDVLPETERRQLQRFNATDAAYPSEKLIHELFEEQVGRTPQAVAVVFEEQSVTYAELNARANQLAHCLRAQGLGPDQRVAICVERGVEMVVGLLGILKAGGAYVPLDPGYPPQRLAYLLRDAQPAVVLTHRALLPRLPEVTAPWLELDTLRLQDLPTHNPCGTEFGLNSRHLAYVIYTSGSTGAPKGAMNEHAAVVNRLVWMQRAYRLEVGERVLQKTPFSFDVSVWEFFWTLLNGATLVVARPDGHKDPAYLVQLIQQAGVSTLHFVPSMLQQFLEHLDEGTGTAALGSLRRVVCSGEALPYDLQERCLRKLPMAQLYNLYGPTEAAVDVTHWHCRSGVLPGRVPIGRPIANTRIHVLDERLQPAPIGVAGEIHIGGAGVARGYLNKPELTRQRFIADPFGAAAGARLYKTGDLGCWLPTGELEYLGRNDFQVKIRGFRIELGEIEAQLAKHPAVSEVAVLAREDKPGDKRLVAYFCARETVSAEALRQHLQAVLPQYMVPAAYVVLDRLPLTPNGKLDRKALPAPEIACDRAGYVAARSPIEDALVRIWSEVLGVARVGVHDDFFELGGHSLLAIRVVARIRSEFQTDFAVRGLFEATTVARLAKEIVRHQTAKSATPLRLRTAPPGISSAILPAPTSFAQASLWFLNGLMGPSDVYHITRAVRVLGPLDVAALGRSVLALVGRHESLRTAFEQLDGAPVQVVHSLDEVAPVLRLEPVPVGGDTPAERELALGEWLRASVAEPFDLSQAPLLRASLLRLSDHEHVLLLVVHHIVADGWSLDVLARELGALYAAFHAGRPDPLGALPIQFADYAVWQRQHLEGPTTERDLRYWRRQLADLEVLQLPTDRARPARPSHRGALERVEIAPEVVAGLKALARRENVTLFMLLLAAFQVLLMRHSGQRDVVVGSPAAGRNRTEFEPLIGYFVNTLVLRSDLSGEPSFVQLLGRVRQVCLDAYAHQELPFDKLVAELSPQRDLSRNPLYQVSFALQNMPASELTLGGLRAERLPLPRATAKFDLLLALTEVDGVLQGVLEYATDLFDAGSIERMGRQLGCVLEAIAADPGQSIMRLPLMRADEREHVLQAWNDTAREFPAQHNLHQLFEAQVRRSPQAIAVILDSQQLGYAELNRRANRLAHHLRTLGVGPDVLVGLCLQRSPALVVALLAILKAGGAYVPLDPQYPSERLAFMLGDTAAPVVITEQALRAQLPGGSARVLCIDSDWAALAHQPDTDLPALATPEHLAYVIYTSGSTGTPKGVAVSHRAVVRLVVDTDYVRLGPADGVAQASNSSFDAATFEIWGALLNGARLVIVPRETLLSGAALAHQIEVHRINTMFLTTALFNEHAARSPEIFRRLDHLLFGGEEVDPVAVQRVIDAGPPKRLLNVYGPTETTTFATWYEVPPIRSMTPPRVPIGRPVANTRCHVLDSSLQPVPVGVVGELYIGGSGLAREYLNRAELTGERFVADPFRPGERLYRTGDLVRYRPCGDLDYCGRIDRQVKLRGFRIELGEIEAALARETGIAQCAVIVREDQPGDKRLVAYVVASDPSSAPSAKELCDRLATQLPSYMLPSSVVMLDALPLTANGKFDRAALPSPILVPVERAARQDSPADDLERRLQRIWENVLGVRPIGPEDSFFELGGHSLLAIKLLDAVDKQFGCSFGLAALFEAPTIRGQASMLRLPQQRPPSSCAVAVQARGTRAPLFFVSGFGGALLPFRKLADELGDDQPLYVLDFNAVDESLGAVITVVDIATQMRQDMRKIQPSGPYHLAGFSLGGKIVYEIAQQLQRDGDSVGLLALLDCAAPGYPRRRSFLVRVALHIKHAWSFEPHEAAAYLVERFKMLKKYFGFTDDPTVFKATDVVDPTAAFVRAIEAQAKRVYDAWRAYVPTFYPGRLTLIRAAVKEYRPGMIEDDLLMGWSSLIGQGVDVGNLQCSHSDMLEAQHARALAALLSERLPGPGDETRAPGERAVASV